MGLPDRAVVRGDSVVSQRVAQIIEAIREYSPELDVQWIPPSERAATDPAFRIVHNPAGGEPYVVFHIKDESEFDLSVLKRIIAGDNRNGTLTYGEVEAAEKAAKLMARQRYLDEQEEMLDKMFHVFKSPLNTYRIDKDLIIKDGIPFNAKGY